MRRGAIAMTRKASYKGIRNKKSVLGKKSTIGYQDNFRKEETKKE